MTRHVRLRPVRTLHAAWHALFVLGWLGSPTAAQLTVHVDQDASAGGDGTSWALAFTDLQDALDVARLDPLVEATQHP